MKTEHIMRWVEVNNTTQQKLMEHEVWSDSMMTLATVYMAVRARYTIGGVSVTTCLPDGSVMDATAAFNVISDD
jgi:hypothetical protein